MGVSVKVIRRRRLVALTKSMRKDGDDILSFAAHNEGSRFDRVKMTSAAKVDVDFIDKLAELHELPDSGRAPTSSSHGILMQLPALSLTLIATN